jgi:transcription elongation factor Elf1
MACRDGSVPQLNQHRRERVCVIARTTVPDVDAKLSRLRLLCQDSLRRVAAKNNSIVSKIDAYIAGADLCFKQVEHFDEHTLEILEHICVAMFRNGSAQASASNSTTLRLRVTYDVSAVVVDSLPALLAWTVICDTLMAVMWIQVSSWTEDHRAYFEQVVCSERLHTDSRCFWFEWMAALVDWVCAALSSVARVF